MRGGGHTERRATLRRRVIRPVSLLVMQDTDSRETGLFRA